MKRYERQWVRFGGPIWLVLWLLLPSVFRSVWVLIPLSALFVLVWIVDRILWRRDIERIP